MQQCHVVGVLLHDVTREDRDEIGVLHHVAEFTRLEASIDRHDYGTDVRRPEPDVEEVHAVGHEDADMIARANAESEQPPADLLGALVHARVRPASVVDHEDVTIGVQRCTPDDEVTPRDDADDVVLGVEWRRVGVVGTDRAHARPNSSAS